MSLLDGAVAVVTGGSRGIGLATARLLARAGARVAITGRKQATLDAAAREIGEGAVPVVCDLEEPRSVARAAGRIAHDIGWPAVVVNNAGVFRIADVSSTTVDDFGAALAVNLVAPFAFIRAFVGDMKKAGRGHIVTVGSIADRHIFPGNAAYSASKFGGRAMHEVLRAELKGTGVRATLVSPGPVDTAIWDQIDPDNQPGFTPRREMLSADAVAEAIMFAIERPAAVNIDELRLSRS